MKKMLAVLCLGLGACDSGLHGDRPLQRGMSEQEVAELKGKQVPDRIIIRTCATATPKPFPCKVMFTRGDCGRGSTARKLPSCSRTSEDSG
jgi:hypothetical protein